MPPLLFKFQTFNQTMDSDPDDLMVIDIEKKTVAEPEPPKKAIIEVRDPQIKKLSTFCSVAFV